MKPGSTCDTTGSASGEPGCGGGTDCKELAGLADSESSLPSVRRDIPRKEEQLRPRVHDDGQWRRARKKRNSATAVARATPSREQQSRKAKNPLLRRRHMLWDSRVAISEDPDEDSLVYESLGTAVLAVALLSKVD